jgi:uncharacterized protein (DUF2147 family)
MLRAMLALAFAALMAAAPAAAAPDPAFGQWLSEDGMGKVAVGPCAGQPQLACGAVTWLKDPVGHPTHDVNNPDRALRSRPLVGLVVIRNMKNAGPGRWTGGKVYDPESGKTYDGKLRALSTDRLQVSGCVLFVCEGEVWTRADD